MALTCDVFTPTDDANGSAVLFVVNGGWHSRWALPEVTQYMFLPLTDKGFTVFDVRHGSSPKFSITEAVGDVRRNVRLIRMSAERFEIDRDRMGAFGISAGGHLSLMLGTASDEGQLNAKDPVDKVSDRVQAVVAYVAPTDLRVMVNDAPERLASYERFPALVINPDMAALYSPLLHVMSDDTPTLLLAGVQNDLVPIFHSRDIHAAFEKAYVPAKLIDYGDSGHGFNKVDTQAAAKAVYGRMVHHIS